MRLASRDQYNSFAPQCTSCLLITLVVKGSFGNVIETPATNTFSLPGSECLRIAPPRYGGKRHRRDALTRTWPGDGTPIPIHQGVGIFDPKDPLPWWFLRT